MIDNILESSDWRVQLGTLTPARLSILVVAVLLVSPVVAAERLELAASFAASDIHFARVERKMHIVCSGEAAGGYAAFPDVCRAKNGELLCVFYAGYGHVSKPNAEWPNGGRVMAVRSTDDSRTWSKPFVIADTVHDDRDPHVAALRDGTLVCNWFVAANPDKSLPNKRPIAVFVSRSADNGRTWSDPNELQIDSPDWFASSAPIRELPDGSLILGLYTENAPTNRVFGATVKSYDGGKTWIDLAHIGEKSGLYLDAETDVIRLTDGTLLAALRSSKTDLYFATSTDAGKTWSEVRSSGFKGHCPHFLRHSSGAILLTHRIPATALHWSFDEGKTWPGPLQIDTVGGAYPSCVELPDKTVYCVYYEEGEGSSIRGARLRVDPKGVTIEQSSSPTIDMGHLPFGGGAKAWLPNLGKLADGTILCAFTQGTAPRLDSIWIAGTRDAGKSWTPPVKVMDSALNGYIADPNILVVANRVTVFATFVPDTTPKFARSETWAATSDDGGKTWGKPTVVPMHRKYVVGKVHVPVTLADGTILMGYAWEIGAEVGKPAGGERRMDLKSGVLRSSDGGRTWQPGDDVHVQEPMGADEPALVVLRNGDLFMIVRTAGPRPYEVRSHDGGQTWDPPQPSRFPGHNSPTALLRLQSGAILRVWDNSETNRYPLVAAISSDECQSWSLPRTITEPTLDGAGVPSYRTACYPSIAQAADGTILVVWWETGSFGSRIGYTRFGPDWLNEP